MIRYADALAELMVDADEVVPHHENANNGDVEAIVESLKTIGCYRPIYASRSTRRILAGHHLYTALLSEGETKVPVLWLDYTEEEERRVLLGDNKIASLAKIDPGLEKALLEELVRTDLGLVGTGYVDADIVTATRAVNTPFHVPQFTRTVECPNCQHTFEMEVDL
jgi:hypothetical protein